MKNISFFILTIFACFLSSCGKELAGLQNVEIEELYVDDKCEVYLYTKDLTIEKVVELQLPEQYDIVQCDKMSFVNGRWYFLDKKSTKIFVFDSEGNFLYPIGEIGRAINELFRTPTNFEVDKLTNELFLFEFETRKVMTFDSLGNFVSAFRFADIWPFDFARQADGDYVFAFRVMEKWQKNVPELAVYDNKENMKVGYFPLERYHAFTANEMPFCSCYDKIAYIPNFSETIYVLDSDTISKGIHISFKTPYMDKKDMDRMKYESDLEPLMHPNDRIHNLTEYAENDYWRIIEYSKGYVMRQLLNKKTGAIYNGTCLVEELFPDYYYSILDDKLVFLVTTEIVDILRSFKEEMKPELWKEKFEASCPEVKMLIQDEIKAPCLFYVSVH